MFISTKVSFRFIALCILGLIPSLLHPAFAQVQVEEAFPDLGFDRPVDIQNAGDGTDRLFVIEQHQARIWVFPNDPATQSADLFLDLSDRVRINGGEEGLLGLAFHPDYASNGFLYVYYSASSPRRSVVERFTVSAGNPNAADIESGLVILEISQPYENHNGGQLAFGPADGYLYIAVGDGGSGGDPQGHGQNRETLLGNILRIDVDGAANDQNYLIPPDNPYAGNGQNYREEIYAYGFRNPWRMSFDAPTGRLWVGDVGQSAREEVGVVGIGENHGWNTMEGFLCYPSSVDCDQAGLTLPIWDYGRSLGQSVTGGHVYRGSRAPEFDGFYLYADFATGRLWALKYIEGQPVTHFELLDLPYNVSSFGVDESGELYILAFNGNIYHLTSLGAPVASFETGPVRDSTITEEQVHFTWSGSDSDGSIALYEVDLSGPLAESYETTDTEATFEPLTDGSYTFCLRAQDNDGLWSPQACVDFSVDLSGLPVELTRFEGQVDDDGVYLSWTTASEQNNAGFSIERQVGHGSVHDVTADRWTAIGFVNGKGTTAASSEYTYQDTDIPGSGTSAFYRLKQIDFDGTTSYSDIVALDLLGPSRYALHDNYPNPFNPSTTIVYDIPVESHVELSVYDAEGRQIEVLVNQRQKAGEYTVAFEPSGLVTGVYFYRLRAGDYEKTGQMLFVK